MSVNEIPVGTKVIFNDETLTFGKEISNLSESNHLLGDIPALKNQFEKDGYLLLGNFFPKEKVEAVYDTVTEMIDSEEELKPGTDPKDAIVGHQNKRYQLWRNIELTESSEMLDLANGSEIRGFFEGFLGGPVRTYDTRWLRAVPNGINNGIHYDIVYMGRGTDQVYTSWIPLSDAPIERSPLILCLGSHKLAKVRDTYGKMDTDTDNTEAVFSHSAKEMVDDFGCQWGTTNFNQGDLIIFGMYMMHASLQNVSEQYRMSVDVRFQLVSEPIDDRHIGPNGSWLGNHYRGLEERPMSEARAEWGL